MSGGIKRGLEKIMGGPAPIFLIIGGLGVGLLTEGISKWVDQAASGEPAPGAVVTIVIGLACFIFGIVYWRTSDLFYRLTLKPVQITLKNQVEPHPGLIVISSPTNAADESPAESAIKYHIGDPYHPKLCHCWIIIGPDIPGYKEFSSSQNAKNLKEKYAPVKFDFFPISKQDDAEEVFNAVEKIYSHSLALEGMKPEDVITDFTGGTKAMSVGMALAGFNHHYKLEVLKPLKYLPDGRADRTAGSIPIQINTNFTAKQKS